jgi:hypothetical protein
MFKWYVSWFAIMNRRQGGMYYNETGLSLCDQTLDSFPRLIVEPNWGGLCDRLK